MVEVHNERNDSVCEESIRLVDSAFSKICGGVGDLSMRVRTLSAQLLGSMLLVGDKFLQQTLDKKLISNLRKKRSAHERAWVNVTSAELGGAFVHGLEDEFLEVRSATLDAMCSLSLK
ncbi:hypothetical protein LSTR_LSTR013944 [Laodelphax striatellus]|uniref:Uncharacterized protein n=1 Tax=Laodelphax striatellus TaxID=195883 RepID=A0A482XUN6_LAOST|nr:hypothetical protein LSTR_LSTR013944 [Laodelphax striatellus]